MDILATFFSPFNFCNIYFPPLISPLVPCERLVLSPLFSSTGSSLGNCAAPSPHKNIFSQMTFLKFYILFNDVSFYDSSRNEMKRFRYMA